jgi:hypothetical protein
MNVPVHRAMSISLGIAAAAFVFPRFAHAQDPVGAPSSVPLERSCARACLYGVLDDYLAALRRKDPWRVKWAADALTTENNVAMPIGEGHWATLTKLEPYDLRVADPGTGQVAMFGALNEGGDISPFVVRLEVRDGAIRRAETLVKRKASDPRFMAEPKFEKKPVFDEIIAPQARLPRARLVSISDGYFDTLQLNDGTLFTQFDDRCNRVENGVQTTNNPALAKQQGPSVAMGCEQQFTMGYYHYDDRLRERRITLVDEERGLVLGMAMMDHSGRLQRYKLTDGSTAESHYLAPHSYYLFELFKITPEGKIRQIEANFVTVPYYTATVAGLR